MRKVDDGKAAVAQNSSPILRQPFTMIIGAPCRHVIADSPQLADVGRRRRGISEYPCNSTHDSSCLLGATLGLLQQGSLPLWLLVFAWYPEPFSLAQLIPFRLFKIFHHHLCHQLLEGGTRYPA